MAWVEQVGNGWRARWRTAGRGAPQLPSPVFDSEAKARDFADDMSAKIAAQRVLAASKRQGVPLALPELFARHVAARTAARAVSADRADDRARELRAMAKRMGWATVADITPAEVERWRTENGGRYARLGAYLRAVLRWAAERLDQPVPQGTIVALRPPRSARRQAAELPAAKIIAKWQRCADLIGANAGALVHCLGTYGWRPIMATRLRVDDVDLKRARIRHRGISAGDDDYSHPILPATVKRLRALCVGRDSAEPLFLDPRTGSGWMIVEPGERVPKTPITDWWRVHVEPARADADTPGVYDLKRYAISTMLARGVPPQDVALFTGHRTLSQVLKYARTSDDRAREALRSLGRRGAREAPKKRARAGSTREHGARSGRFRPGSASA